MDDELNTLRAEVASIKDQLADCRKRNKELIDLFEKTLGEKYEANRRADDKHHLLIQIKNCAFASIFQGPRLREIRKLLKEFQAIPRIHS